MAELLEPPQQQQGHEVADMQAERRGIEAGVDRDRPLGEAGSQGVGVGRIVDQTAGEEIVEDGGGAHDWSLSPVAGPESSLFARDRPTDWRRRHESRKGARVAPGDETDDDLEPLSFRRRTARLLAVLIVVLIIGMWGYALFGPTCR